MTRVGGFDILSHFDVIVRHGARFWGPYDPARYEDVIRPVLENCARNGIALDINSGAVRRYAAQLTPGPLVLRWFREMGGERVTLGSDAHRPEDVAGDLDVALAAARQAGFCHVTQFERRVQRLLPIAAGEQ